VARHEHDALVIADVHGQGDAHAGKHDRVVERNQPQQRLGLGWLGGKLL
jgi:hypothetical protein